MGQKGERKEESCTLEYRMTTHHYCRIYLTDNVAIHLRLAFSVARTQYSSSFLEKVDNHAQNPR